MLVSFGAPSVEETVAGDEVSTRRARFRSQEDQICWLRQMVDEYRCSAAIRARARDIVFRQRLCRPKDPVCHALAIGSWVQEHVTYVAEIPETFQTPTTTVALGYGDCDDHASLVASLLEAIGIESRLVALRWGGGFQGQSLLGSLLAALGFQWDGRAYRHIYAGACIPMSGGRRLWLPLDTTLDRPVAWRTDPVALARERGLRNVEVFIA